MNKNRMEAFSDGVLAIALTIMVLEMKIPHTPDIEGLRHLVPIFLSYVLSFIYVGIYWSNHHHLFQAVEHVHGSTLWANLHLLFWLSLIPFVTGWAGENHFQAWPTALYGFVLLMCAVSYSILTKLLIRHHGRESTLAAAIGGDTKGNLSVIAYLIAIPLALYWHPAAGTVIYALVAAAWLIPDGRIEKKVEEEAPPELKKSAPADPDKV